MLLFPEEAGLIQVKTIAEEGINSRKKVEVVRKTKVPFLIGIQKELAIEILKENHFNVKITSIISTQQKDQVINQSPVSGTYLKYGDYVTLLIGE